MHFSAAEIAEKLSGLVLGDGSTLLTGLTSTEHARPGDLTFAENAEYFAAAERSQASAILVSGDFVSETKVLIRVANAKVAVAKILPLFYPPDAFPQGIHPTAVIDPTADVDPTAHIGPNCHLGPRVKLGARTVLMGGNDLRSDCCLGDDVCLFPNVVLYRSTKLGNRVIIHAGTVVGSDGFGYVFDEGKHLKLLQLGNVIIGDDVEIGANAAIDRGALGATVVGQGTKIDNLVHVAHNVAFGKHCLVMGQAGFAGSTRLGNYVVIASQSGIAGHLKLGDGAVVGAKSGVMRDVEPGGRVLGIPAAPDKQAKRQMIGVTQLPDLIHRIRDLESQVQQLKRMLEEPK
jgi:UDP-3-O-[3-hydroxymyristoyl] glucosamine N-acyltransferase